MHYKSVKILSNENIGANVYKMTLPFGEYVWAGQFFMLKAENSASLLPRPISVCDYENSVLTFLYQAVGRGTGELSRLGAGDALNIKGPLGNGFEGFEPASGKIALVGGGIGTAPMLLAAKRFSKKGLGVTAVCGFKDEALLTGELSSVCGEVLIATESGKTGAKGFVTDILKPDDFDMIFCCGPEPMLKAVIRLCAKKNAPVYASLEKKMACGIGACLVCACAGKDGKRRRVCMDGPVFRGEDIDFDA